jgi:hypothetical protein
MSLDFFISTFVIHSLIPQWGAFAALCGTSELITRMDRSCDGEARTEGKLSRQALGILAVYAVILVERQGLCSKPRERAWVLNTGQAKATSSRSAWAPKL